MAIAASQRCCAVTAGPLTISGLRGFAGGQIIFLLFDPGYLYIIFLYLN